jgi:hypothetical protein
MKRVDVPNSSLRSTPLGILTEAMALPDGSVSARDWKTVALLRGHWQTSTTTRQSPPSIPTPNNSSTDEAIRLWFAH